METTDGKVYPDELAHTRLWEHFANLAQTSPPIVVANTAARDALAHKPGRLVLTLDTSIVWRSTGAAWRPTTLGAVPYFVGYGPQVTVPHQTPRGMGTLVAVESLGSGWAPTLDRLTVPWPGHYAVSATYAYTQALAGRAFLDAFVDDLVGDASTTSSVRASTSPGEDTTTVSAVLRVPDPAVNQLGVTAFHATNADRIMRVRMRVAWHGA